MGNGYERMRILQIKRWKWRRVKRPLAGTRRKRESRQQKEEGKVKGFQDDNPS
jgi:hypothetical protein